MHIRRVEAGSIVVEFAANLQQQCLLLFEVQVQAGTCQNEGAALKWQLKATRKLTHRFKRSSGDCLVIANQTTDREAYQQITEFSTLVSNSTAAAAKLLEGYILY